MYPQLKTRINREEIPLFDVADREQLPSPGVPTDTTVCFVFMMRFIRVPGIPHSNRLHWKLSR